MSKRPVAEKLLRAVRGGFAPSHEYRQVDLADFGHLDLAFYERLSSLCDELGFVHLGDLEDLTLRREGPPSRTAIRVFSRLETGATCALYHFKPSPVWRLLMLITRTGPAKIFELETELTDGTLLQSTTAGERTRFSAPPSIRRWNHGRREPPEQMIAAHERRVEEYLAEHPGVGAIPQATLEDAVAAQNRWHKARHDHLAALGWLTYEDLLRQCGGKEKLARELRREIEAILAEERAAAASVLARPPVEPLGELEPTPDRPRAFGYGASWLAMRAGDPASVAEALGLAAVEASGWRTGLEAAKLGYPFVTPPVDGWVLVVGFQMPEALGLSEDPEWQELMARLSARFGEVQCFANQRVVDHYAWARFVAGEERRYFVYLGETLADRGVPSEEEGRLEGRSAARAGPSAGSVASPPPDEDRVLALAGLWSLDPRSLEERERPAGVGRVGRLAPARE